MSGGVRWAAPVSLPLSPSPLPQEFDEFLVEYGPYMGAPDGEG